MHHSGARQAVDAPHLQAQPPLAGDGVPPARGYEAQPGPLRLVRPERLVRQQPEVRAHSWLCTSSKPRAQSGTATIRPGPPPRSAGDRRTRSGCFSHCPQMQPGPGANGVDRCSTLHRTAFTRSVGFCRMAHLLRFSARTGPCLTANTPALGRGCAGHVATSPTAKTSFTPVHRSSSSMVRKPALSAHRTAGDDALHWPVPLDSSPCESPILHPGDATEVAVHWKRYL